MFPEHVIFLDLIYVCNFSEEVPTQLGPLIETESASETLQA